MKTKMKLKRRYLMEMTKFITMTRNLKKRNYLRFKMKKRRILMKRKKMMMTMMDHLTLMMMMLFRLQNLAFVC